MFKPVKISGYELLNIVVPLLFQGAVGPSGLGSFKHSIGSCVHVTQGAWVKPKDSTKLVWIWSRSFGIPVDQWKFEIDAVWHVCLIKRWSHYTWDRGKLIRSFLHIMKFAYLKQIFSHFQVNQIRQDIVI